MTDSNFHLGMGGDIFFTENSWATENIIKLYSYGSFVIGLQSAICEENCHVLPKEYCNEGILLIWFELIIQFCATSNFPLCNAILFSRTFQLHYYIITSPLSPPHLSTICCMFKLAALKQSYEWRMLFPRLCVRCVLPGEWLWDRHDGLCILPSSWRCLGSNGPDQTAYIFIIALHPSPRVCRPSPNQMGLTASGVFCPLLHADLI